MPENNDYIVQYQDCFIDELNYFYLVLEYCNGGSLDTLIKKNTKFFYQTIHEWSKEMILAIDFLHCNNIIHLDIKPAYV